MKISYVSIHARPSYPYVERPDLHLYQPTLESLNNQTTLDFEWICVDALYEQRRKYFMDMKPNFPVKHVPAQPSFWLEHGLPGVASAYNRGLTYADGELIVFGQDGWTFNSDMLETVWKHYLKGFSPMIWYVIDRSYDPHISVGDMTENPFYYKVVPSSQLGISYNHSGYKGDMVEVDHRYNKAFDDNNRQIYQHEYYSWYFFNSTASLEALLRINGADMKFDGDIMLMDVDLGSRLEMAGYGNFLLDRNLYFVRCNYHRSTILTNLSDAVTIKCNYALIQFNRTHKYIEANRHVLTDRDVEWIEKDWCGAQCTYRKRCAKDHPWQYPFRHTKHLNHEQWFKLWMENQKLFDLEEERELRLDNDDKYTGGTFIE